MAVGEPRAAAAAGSHAAELDSARLGVGDSTKEPKADAALDRTQMRRKERRVWELWAYALLHEDGDTLRQPCTVPLVDDLPWDLRERLCKTYARTIADLQAAIKVRQNAEAGDDARPRSTKDYTTTYTSSQ